MSGFPYPKQLPVSVRDALLTDAGTAAIVRNARIKAVKWRFLAAWSCSSVVEIRYTALGTPQARRSACRPYNLQFGRMAEVLACEDQKHV